MELEELQAQWQTMSKRVENLEIIQKNQIMEITQQRFKNKFTKLWNMELVGAVVCYAMVLWIVIDFGKFDTLFYKVCALVTLLFLAITPFFVLRYISTIKNSSLAEKSYKQTIKTFQQNKTRLLTAQQFSAAAGALVFFMSIPVFSKLFGNDNAFETLKMSQYIFIGVTFIAVLLFMLWGIKKYKRILANAESLLKELEEKE